MIYVLKSLYNKKVPLANAHPNVVFSPAVRLSCEASRGLLGPKNLVTTFQECDSVNVQHVTGYTFIEEETPETPEERSARHTLQAELFQTLEAQRGVSDAARDSELDAITSAWADYFQYMRLRKESIELSTQPKIKSAEITETFEKLVANSYESITVDGCMVYFRLADVDLSRTDIYKRTNQDLLLVGSAPIGADGKSMNLHHLTRRQPGILVLVPESFYQQNSELLHFRSTQHMIQPKPVDRAAFNSWKETALKALGQHLQAPQPQEVAMQLNFDDAL